MADLYLTPTQIEQAVSELLSGRKDIGLFLQHMSAEYPDGAHASNLAPRIAWFFETDQSMIEKKLDGFLAEKAYLGRAAHAPQARTPKMRKIPRPVDKRPAKEQPGPLYLLLLFFPLGVFLPGMFAVIVADTIYLTVGAFMMKTPVIREDETHETD